MILGEYELQWWMYAIIAVCLFLICLLLSFIVKKTNEARFEDRFNRLYEKTSTSTQVQISYSKTAASKPAAAPRKNSDTPMGISMIFTKEENKNQKSPEQPASATDFERIFDSAASKANYFRNFYKGIKLNSNDSLRKKISDIKVKEPGGIKAKPLDIISTNSSGSAQRNNVCVSNSANDYGARDAGDDVAIENLMKCSDSTPSKDIINPPTTSVVNEDDRETTTTINNTYTKFLGTIYCNKNSLSKESNGNIGIGLNALNSKNNLNPILQFQGETMVPDIVTSKTNISNIQLSINTDKIEETKNIESTHDAVQRKVADIIKDFNAEQVKNDVSALSNKLISSKVSIKQSLPGNDVGPNTYENRGANE